MNSEFLIDLFCQDLTEGLRPAFGSPGGKRLLASTIVSYFPEHKVYVEPFVGADAVFFKKKPSQEEILNDKDSEIAFAYKFIKQMTESDVKNLQKFKCKFDRDYFYKLVDSKPDNEIGRFHRFIYLNAFSFGKSMNSTVKNAGGIGIKDISPRWPRFLELKDRFKNVKIYNKDWKDIAKEYDDKNTLFYFDPPYFTQQGHLKTDITPEVINDFLKKLKGKFLLSFAGEQNERKYFPTFSCKNLKVKRFLNQKTSKIHEDNEILLSNFGWSKNKEWLAEEVFQEFHKENYNPVKDTDAQLRDNWRLILAKYHDEFTEERKTEFKDIDEVIKYARMILDELLKRGSSVATFHPDNMTEYSLSLLTSLLKEKIKQRLFIANPEAIKRGSSEYIMPKQYILGQFQILNDGKQSYGFIRLGIPLEDNNKMYVYPITDFIPFEKPINDVAPKGTQTFWSGTILHENTQEFMPERYQPQELQKLNDLELIQRHAEIVRIWKERGARANDEMAINSHAFVADELKRRGLEHRYNEDIDKLSTADFPVKSVDGKYTLEDALKFFNTDFYLKDPFLALTGGTVVSGEGHDWDIWVNWNNPRVNHSCPYCERFLQQLRFRLQSQLPEELQSLIHLVPETEGKFTNYTPLARMKVEFMKPEERTLMRMSLKEQARAASKEVNAEAELSLKEDKLKLFRFFYGMKPTRSAVPNERMTKEFFLSLFDVADFPVFSSKKFDGMRCIIFVDNEKNKIEIWSEDGENITDRIPNIVNALSKAKLSNAIFDAELEKWKDGKHYPREAVAGYIHSIGEPDDSDIVMNIFTVPFYNGIDFHNKTESDRQEVLSETNFPDSQSTWEVPDTKIKINIVPNTISNNIQELSKALDFVSDKPASEGIVAKKANSKYYLDVNSKEGWIKYHKNVLFYPIIIERVKTKVPTIFNYRYGVDIGDMGTGNEPLIEIDGRKIIEVGLTFNTAEKLERGDMIAVEAETINLTDDNENNKILISAWVPRFIPLDKTLEKVPSEPDTLKSLIQKAAFSEVLQRKTINKDGITLYESEFSLEDMQPNESFHIDYSFLSDDDFFEIKETEIPILKEAKMPLESYPKNYGVFVNHFRGKSVHLDFRRRQNGFLQGETLMNEPAGLITEPVDTIEEGKKWNEVLLKKGKFRPDMDPNQKVVMVDKAQQPLEWLNAREVIFEPGQVGATKENYGVLITFDEGMVYPGVQKAYFREFFLDMKNFKGRMVERAIGVGKEWEKPPAGQTVQWQAWTNMVEQTPYLLTSRGREKHEDVPPEGVSWLPPEWEAKVPPDMRWWKPGLSNEQKLALMDKAYNSLIASGELKDKPIKEEEVIIQEKKAKFILRWHWWKGQEVIRNMPAVASHWDLVIDTGKDYLDEWNIWQDPLITEKATADRKVCNLKSPMGDSIHGWLTFEGSIPAIDSKVEEVEVIKKIEEVEVIREIQNGIYSVKKKNGDIIETKETYAKFKPEQIAYLDQYKNLFTGKLGGAAYGNPNQRIPAYMQILDSGNVEWLEDNANFASFKFNGKILDGYCIMKRESPQSTIWTFSKSELPVKEEISVEQENRTIKVSNLTKPVDVNFNGREYVLIPTSSGKLRLDIKNK
jgi:DNA adenine methylase